MYIQNHCLLGYCDYKLYANYMQTSHFILHIFMKFHAKHKTVTKWQHYYHLQIREKPLAKTRVRFLLKSLTIKID